MEPQLVGGVEGRYGLCLPHPAAGRRPFAQEVVLVQNTLRPELKSVFVSKIEDIDHWLEHTSSCAGDQKDHKFCHAPG